MRKRCPRAMGSLFMLASINQGCTSDVGPPPSFESGIDSSEIVAQLSISDARKLCTEGSNYVSKNFSRAQIRDYNCTIQGLTFGETPDECIVKRNHCKSLTAPTTEAILNTRAECNNVNPVSIAQCHIQVSVIEECINEAASVLRRLRQNTSCDRAGSGAVPFLTQAINEAFHTQTCDIVHEECPILSIGR